MYPVSYFHHCPISVSECKGDKWKVRIQINLLQIVHPVHISVHIFVYALPFEKTAAFTSRLKSSLCSSLLRRSNKRIQGVDYNNGEFILPQINHGPDGENIKVADWASR